MLVLFHVSALPAKNKTSNMYIHRCIITPASTPDMKLKISKESMWFGHKPIWEERSGKGIQIRELTHTSPCMILLMMIMLNHDVDHGNA